MPDGGRERLFTACAEKTCCCRRTVFLTGRDMRRIAHALQVDPWSFCMPVPAAPGDRDGFVLSAHGPAQRVALIRTGAERDAFPCVFLLRLPGGAGRCGLGPHRPSSCRALPAWDVCTCRAPAYADAGGPDDEDHVRAVAAWNALAEQLPEERPAGFDDFCRFLLERAA